jgi:hypothetical protein
MTSKVEICNKALALLSANLIMAFDPDESVEAALCVTNYDSARRYCLEKRAWTFATKRTTLSAPLAAAPDWGYSYQHIKPADCLRTLIVSDFADYKDGGSPMDYRLEGNTIVSNSSTLYLKYIFNEITEDRFSSTFVEAMALYLAYLMAMPLTESRSAKKDLKVEFEDMIRAASATDGTQGSSDRIRSPRIINVRAITGRNLGRRP